MFLAPDFIYSFLFSIWAFELHVFGACITLSLLVSCSCFLDDPLFFSLTDVVLILLEKVCIYTDMSEYQLSSFGNREEQLMP